MTIFGQCYNLLMNNNVQSSDILFYFLCFWPMLFQSGTTILVEYRILVYTKTVDSVDGTR